MELLRSYNQLGSTWEGSVIMPSEKLATMDLAKGGGFGTRAFLKIDMRHGA